jgi:hypothetical protein
MYFFLTFSFVFVVLVQTLSGERCPNIVSSVSLEYAPQSKSGRIRFPLFVSTIEMVRLENGNAVDHLKIQSSSITNPKLTTKVRDDYGGGYYYTNFSLPQTTGKDIYVVCTTANIVQNGNVTTCRNCKLAALSCDTCPSRFNGFQSSSLNIPQSRLEIPFYDLPALNMNLECTVNGRNSTSDYNNYGSNYNSYGGNYDAYGNYITSDPNGRYNNYYNTPSYYNSYYNSYNAPNYNSYYYPTTASPMNSMSSESCKIFDSDTFVTKTKIISNSIVFIEVNLSPRSYYDVSLKFEIVWNGSAPFDWPNPFPLFSDDDMKKTFYVNEICKS